MNWRRSADAYGPIAGALTVLGALDAFVAHRLLQVSEGHLVYALDDAYIHMAIAKNLALHGVWGVQAGTFSASSSSPLWTLLLSVWFRTAGVSDAAPLVLNTVFGVACVVIPGLMLRSEGMAGVPLFAVLLATTLLAPLVPLAWTGMEHTLHITLTVLLVWQMSVLIRNYSARGIVALGVLAALTVSARYEGLFVVAGCALVLLLHRRVAAAVGVLTGGAAPVVALGLWNVSHGWFFLPASILMKQTVLGAEKVNLLWSLLGNVATADVPAAFAALLLGALILAFHQVRSSGMRAVHPLLIVFVVAALLHLMLAKFGYLWRYESYLMVLGALATAIVSVDGLRASRRFAGVSGGIVIAVSLGVVLIFGSRTLSSNAVVANTAGHIYRQQYQVARFVGQFYDDRPVALNDIGNVSYYTRARVFDLVGLGSLEAARRRRAGAWDATQINELLRRERVNTAIVYDTWFTGDRAFHSRWQRVGEWVTDVEAERSEGTVTFFASNAEAASRLRAVLQLFNPNLPAGEIAVHVFGPGG